MPVTKKKAERSPPEAGKVEQSEKKWYLLLPLSREAPQTSFSKGGKEECFNGTPKAHQQNLYLGLKKRRRAHLYSLMGKGKSRALECGRWSIVIGQLWKERREMAGQSTWLFTLCGFGFRFRVSATYCFNRLPLCSVKKSETLYYNKI